MGQVVRDMGMTLLVALVIHALYAARSSRPSAPSTGSAQERIYTAAPQKTEPTTEQKPPEGFSVFPWAP